MPIGKLIQKMDRQPMVCVNAPPIKGPSASEMPPTAPQSPTARARPFGSVNTFAMIDSATGFSMDAPRPCNARKKISPWMPGATLHSTDPSVNSVSPIWNTRLRPNRSESEPHSISSVATVSV